MYNWPGPVKRPINCTHWSNTLVIVRSSQELELVILGIYFVRSIAKKKTARLSSAALSSSPTDPEVLPYCGRNLISAELQVSIERLIFLPCSICGLSPTQFVINSPTSLVDVCVCRGLAWHDKMVEYLGTSGNHVGQTSQEQIPKEEPSTKSLAVE